MDNTQTNETEAKRPSKPMLRVDDQIRHLESKGVSFETCGKEEAARYLSEKNYFFKLAAYRKLFEKHVGGENDGRYIGLDFGHLKALASADQQLREVLLPMTLDIEHFVKVDLLRQATESYKEDGYELVRDYCNSLSARNRSHLESEFKSRLRDEYCGAIIEKYKDDMPLWAFVEAVSFGTLIDLVRFCSARWEDKALLKKHYLLKDVKGIRNATAHGACILNGFDGSKGGAVRPSPTLSKAVASFNISKPIRSKMLGNARMLQVSTVFYMYATIVPEGRTREARLSQLNETTALIRNLFSILPENHTVVSSVAFMAKLTQGLDLL